MADRSGKTGGEVRQLKLIREKVTLRNSSFFTERKSVEKKRLEYLKWLGAIRREIFKTEKCFHCEKKALYEEFDRGFCSEHRDKAWEWRAEHKSSPELSSIIKLYKAVGERITSEILKNRYGVRVKNFDWKRTLNWSLLREKKRNEEEKEEK